MLPLGASVVYTVKDKELTKTGKGPGREVFGSVFHFELTQFAGLIIRVYEDGQTADLRIFPPDMPDKTIRKVSEGFGPGEFCPYELAEADGRRTPEAAREPPGGAIERPVDDTGVPEMPIFPAEIDASLQGLIE